MSGRGKGGKVKGKAKSRSSRAGLQFPVGRIHRLLRWVLVEMMQVTSFSGRATMLSELGQELLSTWQQWWSTWLLRSWSWLAMLPETTRSLVSSRGTYSLLSGQVILLCPNLLIYPLFPAQEWWRAEQVARWGDYCSGWCTSQHPGCTSPQEECQCQGESLDSVHCPAALY